ncbi:late secretory pathway protein avl9 [Haplosporangium sp. Z 11]|nr:late secretory pathway protein avl9 [Haplosporangium sp. Z 11]
MGVILHIIVVGFHHAHGPIVEYAFPPFPGQSAQTTLGRLEVPEEWSLLPFLALPDGSHQSDEDFTYFHLPPVKSRKDAATTLFGISCNRQILTKDLAVKTDDVTRSSVQKAVVVLATQARTSLRELVRKFKYKVLVLLKLLLLEKRVLFFGYPVETLCTYQYSLVSLIPGLLKALQDTGSPLLDSQELYMQSMSKTPAHSTDKQELFKYLGLPLHIFGEGSFFQPYLPLQQIDILQHPRTRSYIIGTTNAIFLHNRDIAADVIVNTEPGTIEFLQDSLSSILSLTSADRRWMDEIIEAVSDNGSNDAQTEYTGSDDYLRAKFEEYILTLLSSVKHSQLTLPDDSIEGMGNTNADKDMTADYGTYFIKAWQQTPNYQLWNDYVDWELLNEIIAPGHPCQGNFSLAHVQRRLANQLKDMGIDKNLAPLKQTFSKAMTTSRERLSNVFDSVWQEFEKLQPEEGQVDASYEPAIYSRRSREASSDNKGLILSTSSNKVQRPLARTTPDPDVTPDDDFHDVVAVPSSHQSSPQISSAQKLSSSRAGSGTASPVSTLSSSLGPATAATAALGQKAVGMFSNVSSFFQAKKKELLEAQREAEEQYQQRVLQHERKQKMMQERARATASTFAVSPKLKPSSGPNSNKSRDMPAVYAYVPPQSPTTKSPKVATSSSGSIPIISPIPISPIVISPTLRRGGERMSDQDEGKDVDQESQHEIEKELQEALTSNPEQVSATVPKVLPLGIPARSISPAEPSSSPFSEISAPSTPFKDASLDDVEVKGHTNETSKDESEPTRSTSTSGSSAPQVKGMPISGPALAPVP